MRYPFCHSVSETSQCSSGDNGILVSIEQVVLQAGATRSYQFGELTRRISLEAACRWKAVQPIRSALSSCVCSLLDQMPSISDAPRSQVTRGFLGISKDSTLAVAYVFTEWNTGCVYSVRYYLFDLEQRKIISEHRLCNSLPTRDFSGFVKTLDIIGYFIQRDNFGNSSNLLSFSRDGKWSEVNGVSAEAIAASPDGSTLLLARCIDSNSFELELRSSDLRKTVWKKRLALNTRTSRSLDVLWSTDSVLACVLINKAKAGHAVLYSFDSKTARNVHVLDMPFADLHQSAMLMLEREYFDAKASFGVILTEPSLGTTTRTSGME